MQRCPIITGNKSNPSSRKNLDLRPHDRPTDFKNAQPTTLRAFSWPLCDGRAKEKVMRRRDCVRNLDTIIVHQLCARDTSR